MIFFIEMVCNQIYFLAYLFFYNKQGRQGLGQDAADAVQTHVEEAFSEWILHSAHFSISLLPLMEAWQWSVAAVGAAWESDSSSQLVGSAPQQDGRTSGMGERTEARLAACTGAVQPCRRPPKSQCITVGGGGSPLSSPDRGVPD